MSEANGLSSLLDLEGLGDDPKPTLTTDQLRENNEKGWGGARSQATTSQGQRNKRGKTQSPPANSAPPTTQTTSGETENPAHQGADIENSDPGTSEGQTETPAKTSRKKRKRRTTAFTGPNVTIRTRPGVKEILEDVAYEVDITTQELFEQMLVAYCDRKKMTNESARLKKLGVSIK